MRPDFDRFDERNETKNFCFAQLSFEFEIPPSTEQMKLNAIFSSRSFISNLLSIFVPSFHSQSRNMKHFDWNRKQRFFSWEIKWKASDRPLTDKLFILKLIDICCMSATLTDTGENCQQEVIGTRNIHVASLYSIHKCHLYEKRDFNMRPHWLCHRASNDYLFVHCELNKLSLAEKNVYGFIRCVGATITRNRWMRCL